MTAFLHLSTILVLLAILVRQIAAETQRSTNNDAEEEEKKFNTVSGNGSLRSFSEEHSNSRSESEGHVATIGSIIWRTGLNFTDQNKFVGSGDKSDASPGNNVDNPSSDVLEHLSKEDSIISRTTNSNSEGSVEIDSSTVLAHHDEHSAFLDTYLLPNETESVTVPSMIGESSISDDFDCTSGNKKCKSLQYVPTEEFDSAEVKEKTSYITSSSVTVTSPLWNVMKSIKPQHDLHDGDYSEVFTLQKISSTFMTVPLESSTAQTSENLIPVEGSSVGKDESVIQNRSNKNEKSKHIKHGDTPLDISNDDRVLRTFFKPVITTTAMTGSVKESSSPSDTTEWTSSFFTRLFEFSDKEYTPQIKQPISVSESDHMYYSSGANTGEFLSPTISYVPRYVSEAPEENSTSPPDPYTTLSWYNAKSRVYLSDGEVINKEKVTTPILYSSFSESSNIKSEAISAQTPSVPESSAFIPFTTTSSLPTQPATTILEPQLTSRYAVKDTTIEESIPPPRLTNPGCSSLPICVEITLLDTSWDSFCPQAHEFKEFIARAVSHYTRPIHPHQIVLDIEKCGPQHGHQQQVHVPVSFYVTDDYGEYEEKLTEICGVVLRKWAPTTFRNSIIEVKLSNSEVNATPLPVIPELNSGFVAAVSISAVAGVALCLLCILLVIMKQKLLQSRHSEASPAAADAYSLDSLSINASFRRRRTRRSARSYLNHAFSDQEIPSHPLNVKTLQNCLKNRDLLEEEFKKIPMNMPKLDQIPEGAHVKNRYSNILPKPESRVVLAEPSGDPLKCYINANYIKGYEGKPASYVACQAPLPEGIEDFWRMVWEQQCRVIVMLTMFEENGIARCAAYFPQSTLISNSPYGDFQVSLLKKDVYEFYTMSTLRLLDLEKNLFRDIVHLWYTSWPEVGVPKDPSSLITFVQQCRSYVDCNSGPTIIHCSTGTGRTGVFLALDICTREYDESQSFDILQCVSQLRRDRAGAVQNKDQYILIHEAMLEYISRMANQSQRLSVRSNSRS